MLHFNSRGSFQQNKQRREVSSKIYSAFLLLYFLPWDGYRPRRNGQQNKWGKKTTKQRAGNEFGNIAQAPSQRAIPGQGELADGILQGQRLLRDRIIAAARRQKNIDCSNIYRCYCCCSSSFGKRSNTGQLARPNTEGASEEVPNGVGASRVEAGRVNYYSAQFVHPGPALLFVCQGCFDWMSLARHHLEVNAAGVGSWSCGCEMAKISDIGTLVTLIPSPHLSPSRSDCGSTSCNSCKQNGNDQALLGRAETSCSVYSESHLVFHPIRKQSKSQKLC